MSRPHLLLIDLVAGRDLQSEIDELVVRSALEHRVAGLLTTAAERGARISPAAENMLQEAEAGIWARNRALAAATTGVATVANELGLDIAFIKGITTEARWYGRMGERPAWDMDLVLAPWHRHLAVELVAALQPSHSIIPYLSSILQRDRIQSVDLGYQGLPVDLHLDPLKLEVAQTRYPEQLWDRIDQVDIEGQQVSVFDPTVSLFLGAISLNKDRFRYLIGYSDISRMERDPHVDLLQSETLASREGLLQPFLATLTTVRADLGLGQTRTIRPPVAWDRMWGPSVRLLGKEASVRFRYRQSLIPLFNLRRWPEVAASWWRRLWPTPALLARLYPDLRGPYLVRVVLGRLTRRLRRSRQRRALRSAPAELQS